MTCEVKVIEYSISPYNNTKIATLQLRYWRGIHAEFMTHRVFSRNASSSRAIPIKTFLKQVWNDPAGPIHWGSNQPGMKARQELTGFKKWFAKKIWKLSGRMVCGMVALVNFVAKPHKQTFNRMLEPWQYISVVVTATEWDNFFELRNHPDAQPEIRELAQAMLDAMENSVPTLSAIHMPYVSQEERDNETIEDCLKFSTARCARVSYLTHDGKRPNFLRDIELHDTLIGSRPIHASPTEHQAFAIQTTDNNKFGKNLRGWTPYRQFVEDHMV